MMHAILAQVEHTATWIFAVLIVAFILGAIWAVVDVAVGYASARIVRKPTNTVPLREVRPWHLTAHKGLTSQQEARDRQVFEAVTRIGGRR